MAFSNLYAVCAYRLGRHAKRLLHRHDAAVCLFRCPVPGLVSYVWQNSETVAITPPQPVVF